MGPPPLELMLVTEAFPFTAEFLTEEIHFLADAFDRVRVVPTFPPDTGIPAPLPPGVVVDLGLAHALRAEGYGRTWLWTIRSLSALGRGVANRTVDSGGHASRATLDPRRIAQAGHARAVADVALNWARRSHAPDLVYSYWLRPPGLGLGRGWPGIPLVCRAHGYDLYWERHDPPAIPLQHQLVARSSLVAAVSAHGARYLQSRYPTMADRVVTRYLGIADPPALSHGSQDGILRVVSISNLVPVKRVALIAQAVSRLAETRVVHWRHYGEGVTRQEVEGVLRVSPPRLHASLEGATQNSRLRRILANEPVDVMVNASTSEGLPVSLMEAQAAGIPIVATDVGGTSELLTPLDIKVPADVSAEGLASAMATAAQMDQGHRVEKRRFWAARFRADDAYPAWARELAQLAGRGP